MRDAKAQLAMYSQEYIPLYAPPKKPDVHPSSSFARAEDPRRVAIPRDPLWNNICGEVIHLMGPAARALYQCILESVSADDREINLYCQTDQLARFVQKYDFLILAALNKYFPFLKKITPKPFPFQS